MHLQRTDSKQFRLLTSFFMYKILNIFFRLATGWKMVNAKTDLLQVFSQEQE